MPQLHNNVIVASSQRNVQRASQLIQELLRWKTFLDVELNSFPPMRIKTKYFSASVVLHRSTFSSVMDCTANLNSASSDGLILVASLRSDTVSTFPWQVIASSSSLFRVVVLFGCTSAYDGPNLDKEVEEWNRAALSNGFELVPRSDDFEQPAEDSERKGILESGDVSGSSRIFQLLHNVMWPITSRSAANTVRDTRNRILFVGDNDEDVKQILLRSGFVPRVCHNNSTCRLTAMHNTPGQPNASGSSQWHLSNKYYSADVTISFFHIALFTSQMQDIVANYLNEEELCYGAAQTVVIFNTRPAPLSPLQRSHILSQLTVVCNVAFDRNQQQVSLAEAKVFCHNNLSWKLNDFEAAWFSGKGFEVVALDENIQHVESDDGPICFSRLREIFGCVDWKFKTLLTDEVKMKLKIQLRSPNRLFIFFLCGGVDKTLIRSDASVAACVSRDEEGAAGWQLLLSTKYYKCAVEVIFVDSFDSKRQICSYLDGSDRERRCDSDGLIFVIPEWGSKNRSVLREAIRRYNEVSQIILEHSSTDSFVESTGLRMMWCPGIDETKDDELCSQIEQGFTDEDRIEVLYSGKSDTVPSRLYESIVSIEWPDRDETGVSSEISKSAPSSEPAQVGGYSERTYAEAISPRSTCELPPYMLVDPITQISYVCDALVRCESALGEEPDETITDQLMHLMQTVKLQGHLLPREERLRQARILAEKLGELMGYKPDEDNNEN